MEKREEELQRLVERLCNMLETLSYGSITIIVQDGKVIQLEKHEKMRLK